jgi:hypothetical protein
MVGMDRRFYKSLAIVLAISLSCSELFAAATAGMLRSNGGVSVNGAPVTPLTTVFAGDRIETAPQAAGNLTIGNNSIILDPNSSLVFTGQSMDFYCGGGTIQAKQGMAARYGNMVVKPADQSARFQVQQTGATVKVSALEGNLTLSDGAKNFNIPAGNAMNVPYTGCVQMAKSEMQESVTNGPSGNSPALQPQPSPQPIGGTNVTGVLMAAPASVLSVALTGIIAVNQGRGPISPAIP